MNGGSAKPLLIGIAGGSGSGKTTLCRELANVMGEEATTLTCDSYYHSQAHLPLEERAVINFDHPNVVDFALMAEHLTAFVAGERVAVPTYDFTTHSRIEATSQLPSAPFLLVEGILLFVVEDIRERLDLLVFVDAKEETRFQRRLHRDMRERGRSEQSVFEQWQATVQPMHEKYVEPTKEFADLVVSTNDCGPSCVDVVSMLRVRIGQMRS